MMLAIEISELGSHWEPIGHHQLLLLAQAETPAGEPDSLWSIVTSGGAPGLAILFVLVAFSVTAVYLVVDQSLALRRKDVVPEKLSEGVAAALNSSRLSEAETLLRQHPSVLAGVVAVGLNHREYGWPEVEKSVEDALVDQSARMLRRIDYLSMIANLAPMVGLLGTVTGMIFAFRQVAASQGAAGAGDLAEGIYQALVTTVGGLLVAIPALAASGVLRNRVDALLSEVTLQADRALAPLRRRAAASSRMVSASTPGGGRIVAVPPAQMPNRKSAPPEQDGNR
ncbi:MotA/TolQ/ExbB proton channel family protein [Rhodopirellula sp. JC740]|uniref:MotA/TolQ/ExbB proton channel family protein n=1 Tax=Rhodopirellula halodulae TaxID=2894198 RepID=A0ABS8ND93_9BACT|nr:MotA/TolQ/ExbB proton channel family protein [Rhodopirellula sp. JC740]MCC9641520.1 MotA/TolQ/ExbB proton channel family protein [Rhodopirellula sp. JC740]